MKGGKITFPTKTFSFIHSFVIIDPYLWEYFHSQAGVANKNKTN